jgi:hypothetical protein
MGSFARGLFEEAVRRVELEHRGETSLPFNRDEWTRLTDWLASNSTQESVYWRGRGSSISLTVILLCISTLLWFRLKVLLWRRPFY